MREFKSSLLITLAVLILLFVYFKFAGPIPFTINSIQTTKTSLFSTSGTGKATGIPDTALLSIGVTKEALTVTDAQNQINVAANKIIADLKQLGVEEKNIQTSDYRVSPKYDYTRGDQKITGYTATQTLEVKVTPIDIANKAIDAATLDGANLIGGITFTFNDKTKKDLQNKARTEAIKEAKEKAQSLAKAAGMRLGKIVDIQESGNYEPRPMMMDAALKAEGETADTQLQPGENSTTSTITIYYETL
jgi:hypothetical protein